MPYFSNEKRYRKNSNGFELQEEQIVNSSRKSETKNGFSFGGLSGLFVVRSTVVQLLLLRKKF